MQVAKDFRIGFPTLKQRNIGGFLLFSSDEKSMSARYGENKEFSYFMLKLYFSPIKV